uniref:Uncharacterized protein n=1 Tax=Heterorhabditis bacteriophora TaxID=37862 RepID=A0A1I7W961_HETBA
MKTNSNGYFIHIIIKQYFLIIFCDNEVLLYDVFLVYPYSI